MAHPSRPSSMNAVGQWMAQWQLLGHWRRRDHVLFEEKHKLEGERGDNDREAKYSRSQEIGRSFEGGTTQSRRGERQKKAKAF